MQHVVLVFLCFNRLPDNGTPMPKHVLVDTTNYILLFVLYFTECILWLVY